MKETKSLREEGIEIAPLSELANLLAANAKARIISVVTTLPPGPLSKEVSGFVKNPKSWLFVDEFAAKENSKTRASVPNAKLAEAWVVVGHSDNLADLVREAVEAKVDKPAKGISLSVLVPIQVTAPAKGGQDGSRSSGERQLLKRYDFLSAKFSAFTDSNGLSFTSNLYSREESKPREEEKKEVAND